MAPSEADIVTRAVAGDQEAFCLLAASYQAEVLRLCFAYLLDYDLADEAAQLTLIRAYERLTSLREPAAIRPWLLQIARRTCADLHSPRDADLLPPHTGDRWHDASIVSRAATLELAHALASLSEALRQVLRLHYVDGHPPRRIADYLGISAGAVRKRLFDARRALRRGAVGNPSSLREALSIPASGTIERALAVPPPHGAPRMTFADSFENGLRPPWRAVVGAAAVIDVRAHSGRQSYHIGPRHHDLIRMDLGTRVTGRASVWIFDDASRPLAVMLILSVLGAGPFDTNARVGVFDRWSSDTYYFQVDDGGTSLRCPTAVRRTTGWHRFELVADGAVTSAFVDGISVGQTALVPCFSQIWIGDGWEAEGDETFLDDFELMCSPAFT